MKIKVAIIGGTGIDQDDSILDNISTIVMPRTPYGNPSDPILLSGKCKGVETILMARHGKEHSENPSDVNYRANIWALKTLNCTHIIATTACGSLREAIKPETYCILDQYIDRTKGIRGQSLFKVCHIPQSRPFDRLMQAILEDSCRELGCKYYPRGITVTVEGPRFSTLAESNLYRSWGADVINMTTVPEAQLAAEAGLFYCALGLVTDFDCWHDDEKESVTVDLVKRRLRIFRKSTSRIITGAIERIVKQDWTEKTNFKQKQIQDAIMFR